MKLNYGIKRIVSADNEATYLAPKGSSMFVKVSFYEEDPRHWISHLYLVKQGQERGWDWKEFNRHTMTFSLGRYVRESEFLELDKRIRNYMPVVINGYHNIGTKLPAQFDDAAVRALDKIIRTVSGFKFAHNSPSEPYQVYSRTFVEMSDTDINRLSQFSDSDVKDLAIQSSTAASPCMHPYEAYNFLKETVRNLKTRDSAGV